MTLGELSDMITVPLAEDPIEKLKSRVLLPLF